MQKASLESTVKDSDETLNDNLKLLYNYLEKPTLLDQYKFYFDTYSYSDDGFSKLCSKEFVKNKKETVLTLLKKALNDTKINEIKDEYSPYLMKLKKKYSELKNRVNNTNRDFTQKVENFEKNKEFFVSEADKNMELITSAITSLNFISKYIYLGLKNDVNSEFTSFKNKIFPDVIKGKDLNFTNEITEFMFNSYCTEDEITENYCMNDERKEKELKNKLIELFKKLENNQISEPKEYDIERVLALLKELKNTFGALKDIVEKKEISHMSNDMYKDFEVEIDFMNDYFEEKSPLDLKDIIEPADSEKKPNNDKSEYNVWSFKQHFKNLLESTSYICYSLNKDIFNLDP